MSDDIEIEIDIEQDIEIEIDFPDLILDTSGGGGTVTVTNSDNSYTQSGTSPLVLPDEDYAVFVNGVKDNSLSFSIPGMKSEIIVIQP